MFGVLFTRPYAIANHRNGPLAGQRRRYLAHCAERGVAIPTLLVLADYLLTITKYLKLGKRGNELISMAEVEAAAARWSNRRPHPPKWKTRRHAQRRFLRDARRWLHFIGRLEQPVAIPHAYAERVAAFAKFQMEKGLSSQTIRSRGRLVQMVLDRLSEGKLRMEKMTPAHIDATMSKLIIGGNLTRVSIRTYAAYLRAFFRYAETRGWCRAGLAAGIMAPCIYAHEGIPSGPSWKDVQRLLATTERDRPSDIRDRALLLLLIVYGFRSGEVRQLRLDDLDWEGELIHLRRSKQRRTQVFPLSRTVGDAILRYLKEVRPRTTHREVFLALNGPYRPLRDAALRQAVAWRLRSLGVSLRHYGPHALRHSCATRLLNEGHSLKEIGDYLGHSCPESTLVYAKVDDAGLRAVADFNLEGLL